MSSADTATKGGALVTAISRNHYHESLGFIQTGQKHLLSSKWSWPIAIYDLGDLRAAETDQLTSLCLVEYRGKGAAKPATHSPCMPSWPFRVTSAL